MKDNRQEFIENCIAQLMRFKDYSPDLHPRMFELNYQNEKVGLIAYAAQHLHDPKGEMFAEIEESLTKFVLERGAENVAVIVEGNGDVADVDDRNGALLAGESVFTPYLARQLSVAIVESPEPSEQELQKELEKLGFTLNDYIFRQMLLNIDYTGRIKGEAVTVQKLLDYYRWMYGLFKYDWVNLSAMLGSPERLNYAHLKSKIEAKVEAEGSNLEQWLQATMVRLIMEQMKLMCRKYEVKMEMPEELTPDSQLLFNESQLLQMMDPQDSELPGIGIFPRVAGTMSVYRDQAILRRMFELLDEGKSVFVVFGASHVYMWKPALEAYFD